MRSLNQSPIKVNVSPVPKTFTATIDAQNRSKLYSFKVGKRSSFNLNLTGLQANANAVLLDRKYRVVGQSRKPGKQNEAIYTTLKAGTYYVRVTYAQRQGGTRYQLKLSTANAVPAIRVNQGLNVGRGTTSAIASDLLKVTDRHQKANQLVYTLTGQPQNGWLQLNGQVLAAGNTFTQADINGGRLTYTSIGKVQLNQNSNNFTRDASIPRIDGNYAVWVGNDGKDYEIYAYNILNGTVTQLTDNQSHDSDVRISGNYVVWSGSDGGDDSELFLHNLATGLTQQITNNTVADTNPRLAGNKMVWSQDQGEGMMPALMFYDAVKGTTVTLNQGGFFSDMYNISEAGAVWAAVDGVDSEIFFYDGNTTRQLTNNEQDDYYPQISGSNVVWAGSDGNDFEIFWFDGNTTRQLTQNNSDEFYAVVSGANIAWTGKVGNNNEVFLYNGGVTTRLTNSPIQEYGLSISGNNLVWQHDPNFFDTSIFFFDGVNTTQLVDLGLRNSLGNLSGNTVGWVELQGNKRVPFLYNGATGDRFSFSVADGLGGVTYSEFNIKIN